MSTPLKEIRNPKLVFVKKPTAGVLSQEDEQWILLERFLIQRPHLTKNIPMLFDTVWVFDERNDAPALDELVSFLQGRLTYRICKIDGTLEVVG